MFHGKGGYSFGEVYNLPIWLRDFIYNEMSNFYKTESTTTQPQFDELNKKLNINTNQIKTS